MIPDILKDNFALLADTPGGVKKLRELVLQLGVTGRLVPQNAREESHADFEIGAPEQPPFPVPVSWKWTTIGGCTHDFGCKVPDGRFTYIDVSSIDNVTGRVSTDAAVLDAGEAPSRARRLVALGTVIYSTVRPYLLNVAIIDREIRPEPIVSTAFAVLHPRRGLSERFLYHYLRSGPFVRYVESQMTGIAYPAINDAKMSAGPAPIPPLAEQKRIVAKVDELMVLCDELEARQEEAKRVQVHLNQSALARLAESTDFSNHWKIVAKNFQCLEKTPDNVSNLRKTILQMAVTGQLTSLSVQRSDLEGLPFYLPEAWSWARIEDISSSVDYGTSHKASSSGVCVPVLRMNNIRDGKVHLENLKYVPKGIDDLPRLYLQHGDLLFNRTNSYELVGKAGVFLGESNEYTFASYLIRVTFNPQKADSRFVNLALNAPYFRLTQIEPELTQQCGQANFSGGKLKVALVPLPPLAEQMRIVARVGELMKLCDELETQLERAETDGARLFESIIAGLTAG